MSNFSKTGSSTVFLHIFPFSPLLFICQSSFRYSSMTVTITWRLHNGVVSLAFPHPCHHASLSSQIPGFSTINHQTREVEPFTSVTFRECQDIYAYGPWFTGNVEMVSHYLTLAMLNKMLCTRVGSAEVEEYLVQVAYGHQD